MRAAGFLLDETLRRSFHVALIRRNYALRAAKSQDQKEAAELLSKAILELAMSIEATDAKVKKINKSS